MTEPAVKNKVQPTTNGENTPVSELTIYTDPLCCWSWGARTHWAQLQQHLGEAVSWNLRMGGLLPSWNTYHDDTHSVSRPGQMGPLWLHASQLTGVQIQTQLWHTDPPTSSYPSCVAVKAAGLQSPEFAWRYFDYCQHACMLEGLNIAQPDVLLDLAKQLALECGAFDADRFAAEYRGEAAMDAFRCDLQDAQYQRINRLPTIIVRKPGGSGLMIGGFRTFAALLAAIQGSPSD